MKRAFPELHVSINGGIATLDHAADLLNDGLDGVMIGRAAYHQPADILLDADQVIWGETPPLETAEQAVELMKPYIEAHLAEGGKLAQVTRHMLGLFAGRPGARGWRRVLSENAHRSGAGLEVLDAALAQVTEAGADAAERLAS